MYNSLGCTYKTSSFMVVAWGQYRINLVAKVAYATGPTLSRAPRFWGFFLFYFCLSIFFACRFFPQGPPPLCYRPRTSLPPRFQGPRAPYAFGGVSFLLFVEHLFFFFFVFFFVDLFPRAPPPVCYRPRTSLIWHCLGDIPESFRYWL